MAIRTTLWNSRLTLPALGCLGWVGLVGCKPVDPAESPFQARKVEAAAAAALPSTGPDPRFEEKDRLTLTSEQLASGAVGSLIASGPAPKASETPGASSGAATNTPPAAANGGTAVEGNPPGTPTPGVTPPGVVPAGVTVMSSMPANVGTVTPATMAATPPQSAGGGLGAWPIRLVRT